MSEWTSRSSGIGGSLQLLVLGDQGLELPVLDIRKRTSLTGRAARLAVIPSNYHIMYSLWDGTPVYNPYDFPLFAVRMKHGNKTPLNWDALHKCPGNCQVCLKTGRGCPSSETSFVYEH